VEPGWQTDSLLHRRLDRRRRRERTRAPRRAAAAVGVALVQSVDGWFQRATLPQARAADGDAESLTVVLNGTSGLRQKW